MDEIKKKYRPIIRENTKLAKTALEVSDKALDAIRDIMKKEILDDSNYSPSGIIENIVQGKYQTVLEANVALAKALAKYSKVKEKVLLISVRDIKATHSNIRAKRDVLKARFLSDPVVNANIKTIKHQEMVFGDLFADFLEHYNNLKINLDRLSALEEYLTQGFYAINAMNKFLYNQTFQEGQEMAAATVDYTVGDDRITYDGEEERPKKTRRKRRVKKRDLD